MTISFISFVEIYRRLSNNVLNFKNWIYENSRPLLDLVVLLFLLGVTIPVILVTDAAEVLYNFSRAHEKWQMDEIILALVVVSVFLAIFATRRWVDTLKFMRSSNTDSLTGLFNRRKGWDVLDYEMHRAKRYQRPLCLIAFDIDHYKEINDSLGHPAGDRVLRKVSKIIQNELRSTDTLVRWGGDEFMIVSIETDLHTARRLAERLRESIGNYSIPDIGNVTASFGVVKLENEDDLNSFIRRADDRLYAAKAQGRNQVA